MANRVFNSNTEVRIAEVQSAPIGSRLLSLILFQAAASTDLNAPGPPKQVLLGELGMRVGLGAGFGSNGIKPYLPVQAILPGDFS